jgi:hypothetical protein
MLAVVLAGMKHHYLDAIESLSFVCVHLRTAHILHWCRLLPDSLCLGCGYSAFLLDTAGMSSEMADWDVLRWQMGVWVVWAEEQMGEDAVRW